MKINQLFKIKDLQTKILLKNSSWVLGSNVLRAVVVFFRGIVIARGLGAELFGTLNIIAAFAGLIQQFLGFTIGSAIMKFGASYFANKEYRMLAALVKGGLYISALLALVSVLVITGFTLFIYDVFFEDPDLETFVVLFAIITSTSFIDKISKTLLRLLYRFKEDAFIVIGSAVADLIIIGIAVYTYPRDFAAFFYAMLIGKLLASVLLNGIAFIYVKKLIGSYWNVPIKVLRHQRKALQNYTLNNTGSRVLRTFMNNGDVLLLGALLGPIPVGFYNIAKKLAQSIMIVIDPLTLTLFPQLSILIAEKKYGEIKVMIRKVTRFTLLPCVAVIVGLFVFREDIIVFAYGIEYIDAAKPFIYLAINAILGAVLFWHLPLLLSMGLVKLRLQINAMVLILGATVAYVITPSLGATGTAIGLLLANGSAILIFSAVTYSRLQKGRVE